MARILTEQHLQKMFMTRYMSVHDYCLRSISDLVVAYIRATTNTDLCRRLIEISSGANVGKRMVDPDDIESDYFRNLRNAWYHEYAFGRSGMDVAAWKIVQAYYAIYCSISSLVRTYYHSKRPPSHKNMLRIYTNDFIINPSRRRLLTFPLTIHLRGQLCGAEDIRPTIDSNNPRLTRIENGLKWAKSYLNIQEETVAIPHYLLGLRDWANYEDAYLFFMLYGYNPKVRLEIALNNLVTLYLTHAESYMIRLFGWSSVKLQYQTFIDQLQSKLQCQSPRLQERFLVYEDQFE